MAVDSKPPVVKSFEFIPSFIDIEDGSGTFSVKLNVADGASGIKYVSLWVTSPAGKHAAAASLWEFTGSDTNRTYKESFTVNKFLDPGKYTVTVELTDNAGNTGYYDLNTFLRVTNGADGFADGRSYYIGANSSLTSRYDDLYLSGKGDFLGRGNSADNKLFGNLGDNKLFGLDGNDRLSGGHGDDTLIGGNDADRVIGGDGNDTASYQGASGAVIASLEDHRLNTGDATGDLYFSVENLVGSSFADRLVGDTAVNAIKGAAGNDTLIGGIGADKLYGGAGADTFVFRSQGESTLAVRDTIYDFSRVGGDKIDLSAIDADTNGAADQAFTFIGTNAFSGVAGELRYVKKVGDTFINSDVNGDGVIDFSVRLDDPIDMRATDFLL